MVANTIDVKQREKLIADYRASAKSVREWCSGIKLSTMYGWSKQAGTDNADAPKLEWISVELERPLETTDGVLVSRAGQVVVEVRSGFDPNLLGDVVKVLVESS